MIHLDKAKNYLINNDLACVVLDKNDNIIIESKQTGVKTLLSLIDNNKLENAFVADKIIGKAAACILAYGNIKKCYGRVMSESAIKFFEHNNIQFEYDEKVDYIQNRDKTGSCPMEKIVYECKTPKEGYNRIIEFLNTQ